MRTLEHALLLRVGTNGMLSAVALAQCNIFQACFACVTALTTGWYVAGAALCVHLLETAQTQECGFIVQCCLPCESCDSNAQTVK